MVDFRFNNNDLKDLIAIAKRYIKGEKRYHLVVLDTKRDLLIKEFMRGF
jgi:uncharacterized Fe-S radical SAM superfamily protein PflX